MNKIAVRGSVIDVADLLRINGYEVVEGAEETKKLIERVSKK